jgi:tetratricopeptide (TPR) repeat protein
VTAIEVGDDPAAMAARRRLGPLLADVQDPFLHAVSRLVMAWTASLAGDFDGALREASASLEELLGQDEPFWTAVAVLTVGSVETAVGHHDGALRHLTEMRDLAERFDNPWLAANCQVQLGTLALARGRFDDARGLLEEGLELSLAAQSTHSVSLSLAAFARLALAEGDPDRAALVAGAAEGLRRRVGLPAWPMLRRGEAELVNRAREAMGADRFDRRFATGNRLSQREALAAVADRRDPGSGTAAV